MGYSFPISSKVSFICTIPDRIAHTTAFVTPVMEHWLEREICVKQMTMINFPWKPKPKMSYLLVKRRTYWSNVVLTGQMSYLLVKRRTYWSSVVLIGQASYLLVKRRTNWSNVVLTGQTSYLLVKRHTYWSSVRQWLALWSLSPWSLALVSTVYLKKNH